MIVIVVYPMRIRVLQVQAPQFPGHFSHCISQVQQMICILDPGMGADDLLPLFTYVLALSNCKHLQTNIAYVSALLSKRAADGSAGYAFTTMQLAVEYVSQT